MIPKANIKMINPEDPDPLDRARSDKIKRIAATVIGQPSYSVDAAAAALGLSSDQIRDLIYGEYLPNAYQETPRKTGRFKIPEGDITAYKARVAGFTPEGGFYYDQPVYTVAEAAEALGLSAKQVRGLIDIPPGETRSSTRSAFPNAFKRMPKAKHSIMIPASDVEAYMVRQAPLKADLSPLTVADLMPDHFSDLI